MARNIDWLSIEGAYRAGIMSLRAIADAFGGSPSGILKKAKQNGWTQDPTGMKREIVKSLIAGISSGAQGSAQECTKAIIYAEADKDAQYMGDCLGVAVKAVGKLNTMIDDASEPRDIKIIVDANKSAMETIRKIRGLDDVADTPINEGIQVTIKRAAKRETD